MQAATNGDKVIVLLLCNNNKSIPILTEIYIQV